MTQDKKSPSAKEMAQLQQHQKIQYEILQTYITAMQAAIIDTRQRGCNAGMDRIFEALAAPGLIPSDEHKDADRFLNQHDPYATPCRICGQPSLTELCSTACLYDAIKADVPEQEHARLDQITAFCEQALYSEQQFNLPFSTGDYSYATNGHLMIRVPRITGVPEMASDYIASPDVFDHYLSDDPDLCFVPVTSFDLPGHCPDCEGTGWHSFATRGWLYDTPCKSCKGSGLGISEHIIHWPEALVQHYRSDYLRQLEQLPELAVCEQPDRSMIRFRFSEGEGLLMAVRQALTNEDARNMTRHAYARVITHDGKLIPAYCHYDPEAKTAEWRHLSSSQPFSPDLIYRWQVASYYGSF
ncbi:hypothetical protein [Oceanospirillum sediminis]|uniref:Uncharacterized protein n=1 Tax=Oceanospirillum sediminis TaxID=2760088 RepID=A0A839IWX8_9GAMM|nr:hypothetical protein [Oceanospirillum sediminis]MBB1489471.1 hypothetical protein [Oceanospirillum sediminis]